MNSIIEASFGVAAIVCGILAIVLSIRARGKMTEGLLREYSGYVTLSMFFLIAVATWHVMVVVFGIIDVPTVSMRLPEYFLALLACLTFLLASSKIHHMGEHFGFKEKGKEILDLVERKKHARDMLEKKENTPLEKACDKRGKK